MKPTKSDPPPRPMLPRLVLDRTASKDRFYLRTESSRGLEEPFFLPVSPEVSDLLMREYAGSGKSFAALVVVYLGPKSSRPKWLPESAIALNCRETKLIVVFADVQSEFRPVLLDLRVFPLKDPPRLIELDEREWHNPLRHYHPGTAPGGPHHAQQGVSTFGATSFTVHALAQARELAGRTKSATADGAA